MLCTVKDCTKEIRCLGLCQMHYYRWRRHKDVMYGTPEYRYWKNVDKRSDSECWPWLAKAKGGKSKGYGQFSINNKTVTAHRFTWELYNGPILNGLHVLHNCDTPICVNPKHLFLGTNQDNINDKMGKGRWRGGRPKFIPRQCPRCNRIERLTKGHCRSCYVTLRRQIKRHTPVL